MASVLETRLNEVLRFTLGRTYGVSVTDSFHFAPPIVAPDQPLPGTVMVRLHSCCLWLLIYIPTTLFASVRVVFCVASIVSMSRHGIAETLEYSCLLNEDFATRGGSWKIPAVVF